MTIAPVPVRFPALLAPPPEPVELTEGIHDATLHIEAGTRGRKNAICIRCDGVNVGHLRPPRMGKALPWVRKMRNSGLMPSTVVLQLKGETWVGIPFEDRYHHGPLTIGQHSGWLSYMSKNKIFRRMHPGWTERLNEMDLFMATNLLPEGTTLETFRARGFHRAP